jgi:DNA primase
MKIITELSEVVSQLDDRVARSLYIGRIAEHTDIEPEAVAEKVKAASVRQQRRQARASGPKNFAPRYDSQQTVDRRPEAGQDPFDKLEQQIVAMLTQRPKMAAEIKTRGVIERFENPLWRDLATRLVRAYDSGQTAMAQIVQEVENVDHQRLLVSLSMQNNRWNDGGCLRLLDQFAQARQRQADPLLKAIAQAEASGDHELLEQLLQERQVEVRQKRLKQ